MTTRLELRTEVRRRLEDTSGNPLWDDPALNDFLTEAVRAYGASFPKEVMTSIPVSAGAATISLPASIDASRIIRVNDQNGELVPRQRDAVTDGIERSWRVWGGNILLSMAAAATGDWQIESLGTRTLPGDDVTAVEIIPGDEEIVVLLAAGAALRRRITEDAKRGIGRDAQLVVNAANSYQQIAMARMEARKRRARGSFLAARG
jgi:hypothetical protein